MKETGSSYQKGDLGASVNVVAQKIVFQPLICSILLMRLTYTNVQKMFITVHP